ncbi:MAG TPA: hypothetical protein VNH11_16260 [Pirellulales bacterium]|nr:hypothetical protein [Pirellulales bacterium]
MPFIVQCPHADCRKFMLLEDSTRGGTVDCLVCKKPIKVEAGSSGEAPAVATGRGPPSASGQPAPPSAAEKVCQCPHCQAPLRLPSGKINAVKCPKCAQVFEVAGP